MLQDLLELNLAILIGVVFIFVVGLILSPAIILITFITGSL